MPAIVLDGKALAAKVREEVAADVAGLGHVGLTTVLVGDDPASHVYINLKHKAAESVGIEAQDLRLPAGTTQADLLDLLAELNGNDGVDGILVQLPLPGHIDENAVIEAISPAKDIDGLHPLNAAALYLGHPRLVPGTPKGIMRLLDEYEIGVEGKRAVVVGRSAIVGKPIAMLLLLANATVTVCHSRTADLGHHTRDADILVAAIGRPNLISGEMVKPGAAVIDVGINRTDAGLVGDVDPGAAQHAAYLTPVPGGVGPMTIAMVLENTVAAARARRAGVANATG
jgi:methylenetetrahydrofolate dehydrogenase (NADP+)/methenyltetrahydrofolate cyclohydrolase